jgi:hypothetical protein
VSESISPLPVFIRKRARSAGAEVSTFVLSLKITRHCPVDQAVALNNVQRPAEGRAVPIDHRERSDLLADRVDHQRIALIVSDGLALPGGRRVRRMGHVHAHAADAAVSIGDVQSRNRIALPVVQSAQFAAGSTNFFNTRASRPIAIDRTVNQEFL